MTKDEFQKIVHAAIKTFSQENPRLKLGKSAGACERSICFRLGLHLAKKLETKRFFVDSEYNIDLSADALKALPNTGKTGRVFPDLIVHKRTVHAADNLSVIEVKFSGSGKAKIVEARERIIKFRRKYGYSVGVVIILPRSWEGFLEKYVVEFI